MDCRPVLLLFAGLFIAGCATGPGFNTQGVDPTLTPSRAVSQTDLTREPMVLWGGVIIDTRNLRRTTQIEVLGYPLSDAQRPDTEEPAMGRFLVSWQGFLEPVDYAPGRLLTVKGLVTEIRSGEVGETGYSYPLVAGQQLHLWPQRDRSIWSHIHFGVGFSVHN